MRRVWSIVFLFACFFNSAQDNAIAYLSTIDGNLKLVQAANLEYITCAARGKPARTEHERQELIQALSQAYEKISAMPPYNGSTRLRDSALVFLRISHALVIEDYGQVASLEPIAESAFDAMEAYMGARAVAQSRLHQAGAMLEQEYSRFAEENRFGVQPVADVLSGEMNAASLAYTHYNRVYDIFFRNYKQEAYFLDAIAEGHISAIDQNRAALERSAEQGLLSLEGLPPFGDQELRQACKRLLSFYHSEATVALAEAARYFVDLDDMNRRTELISSARPGETDAKTQARHAEALADFRKRSETFSKTKAVLAHRRHALLSDFQKAADHYMKRHIK